MKNIGIWIGITTITIAIIWGMITLVNTGAPNYSQPQTTNPPPTISKNDMTFGSPKAKAASLTDFFL